MNGEKIIELINQSELPPLQKNIFIGFIKRKTEEHQKHIEDKRLIEKVCNEKNVSEILLSNEDVKIYTISGKDEWDKKYPYRVMFYHNRQWTRCNTVSDNFDQAFLLYLECKHLQSRRYSFTEFCNKILGIEEPK